MIRRKKMLAKKQQIPDARGRKKETRHGTRHWTSWTRESTSWPMKHRV